MAAEAFVKIKSQELQIPFANLASAFVIETFLSDLEKSEYKEFLWLKNAGSLDPEHYRRKPLLHLEFYYRCNPKVKAEAGIVPGQKISRELVDNMLEQIFAVDGSDSVVWKYLIQQEQGNYRIGLTAEIGSMQIPVTILLENLQNEKLEPYQAPVPLLMKESNEITLLQYPMEYIVADGLADILEMLELINDMERYQHVYTIAARETLDGRKIQQQLAVRCHEKKISYEERRIKMLESYRGYAYMRKKWNLFLKSENRKAPSWEEVLDKVHSLLSPIWKMSVEDMIFIGDWMPELKRYLD